eukprot:Awhi_evm1s2427
MSTSEKGFRLASMVTNKSAEFNPDMAVARFNRKYAVLTFFSIILFLCMFNVPLYTLSSLVSKESGLVTLTTLGYDYYVLQATGEYLLGKMAQGVALSAEEQVTLASLESQGAELTLRKAQLAENSDKLWSYFVSYTVLSIVFSLFPLIFLIWFRNHKHVRNRGEFFVFHLAIATVGYFVLNLLVSGIYCLRYDILNKTERQVRVLSEILFLLLQFFLYFIFGAFVCRMRMVYTAFGSSSTVTVRSRSQAFLEYTKPLLGVFLLFLIPQMISILFLAGAYDGVGRLIYNLPSYVILCVIVLFYTLKCRLMDHAIVARFSDFFINSIISVMLLIVSVILAISRQVNSDSIYAYLAIFYVVTLIMMIYIFYPVVAILYVMWKDRIFQREKRPIQSSSALLELSGSCAANKRDSNIAASNSKPQETLPHEHEEEVSVVSI